MLGTIVNCITIIVGGLIGSVFSSRIGERYTKPLMTVMGFATAVIGIQGALGTSNILVVIICLALGTLIGVALRLDDRINGSGDFIKSKLSGTKLGGGRFSDAFVTATLVFCVGSMAILGPIQAGLNHDYSILFTKSIMDFISSIAFSAALGPGVCFAAVPILIVQGGITLLAGAVQPYLTAEVITEMTAVGGPIFLAMSVNLIGLREEPVKVGDMIPAIFLPILYFPIVEFICGLF